MKKLRQQIYDKYGGKCGYTGKPLDDKWQVDHIIPQILFKVGRYLGDPNHIDNLMPACRIINHYKRGETLEGFRAYMSNFHIRLSKLPKKTQVLKTIKRKEYLNEVARLFDITVDKPFTGVFYFETLQ